jgi:hypothetical protein
MERRQIEAFDDTFVADRYGREPGDQCFDSVHVRAQRPEPAIEANHDRTGKHGSNDRSASRPANTSPIDAADVFVDGTARMFPVPEEAKPVFPRFNHHRPLR